MADTLSRAPLNTLTQEITSDTEMFMQSIITTLPATKDYLDTYCTAQLKDHTCSQLIQFCDSGWPNRNSLKGDLRKYRQVRASLTVNDNLLLFGSRIVVPDAMRAETLRKIHKATKAFGSVDLEYQQQFGGQESQELLKISSEHVLNVSRQCLYRESHS